MTRSDSQRYRLLVEGLVGPYYREYQEDAEFHAAVETIALAIPGVIQSMAEEAAKRKQALTAMSHALDWSGRSEWTTSPDVRKM